MPRITVLQLDPTVPLDRFEGWLRAAGARLSVVPVAERGVPSADAVGDGLLVLGGRMDAHAVAEHPWLSAVGDLLADAIEIDLPVLGICLGHQILADALGGEVTVADPAGGETGATQVVWAEAAASDPVLAAAAGVGTAVAESHHDVVTRLPEGAVLLASSEKYPHQAFRVRSAVGVQFHPEASPELVRRWEEADGNDTTELVAGLRANDAEIVAVGRAVAEGFVRACA